MRTVALLIAIAGCGEPVLGGAPHPNNAAMAGGVAAAAAALTLADPNAADRKPEQRVEEEKRPVDVKDQVPASALDRLDSGSGAGSGSGKEVARPRAKPADANPADVKTGGPGDAKPMSGTKPKKLPVLPTPHDAVDPNHADRP
jgi:hypothetical protein